VNLTLTRLADGQPTDNPDDANQITIRTGDGRRVMTLVLATHPMYRVQGYTLNPHPKDPNSRAPHHYSPDAFADGYLDQRLQNRMWVDPDATQPGDTRRDPANWDTLVDLLATLKPLLKD